VQFVTKWVTIRY